MPSERLNVILRMDAGQYRREARQASTATRDISDGAQQANKNTGLLNKEIGATGLTMRTVFAGAAGAAATKFLKDSIDQASSLNESINAVSRTYGPFADGILELGENAAESVGLANSEFNQLAVGFGAFVNQIDNGRGQTIGILDDLTTRVADFASVMDLDVPEAAEKFRSGLAGETEPLRKFGIDVSAARVETFAYANGIAEAGEELTENQKVLARYGTIMEQTEKTSGDFAATSDDYANATRIATAQLKDFQATVGGGVLPILGELVQTGSDVITIFQGIADAVPDFAEGITDAGALVNVALFGLPDLIGRAADAFKDAEGQTRAFRIEQEQQHKAQIMAAAANRDTSLSLEELAHFARESGEAAEVQRVRFEQGIGALEDTEEAAYDAADGMRDFLNAQLASIDPAFALLDASDRYQEALERQAELEEDAEATQRERDAAARDVLTTFGELIGASQRYADVTGVDVEDAIRTLGTEAGLTGDQIQTIIDSLDEVDGKSVEAELKLITKTVGGGFGREFFEANTRQHGGPVAAGQPYLVGERGREMFIPSQPGMVASNQDTERLIAALKGSGGESVFNINMQGTGDPHTDPQRIGHTVSILRRMETLA